MLIPDALVCILISFHRMPYLSWNIHCTRLSSLLPNSRPSYPSRPIHMFSLIWPKFFFYSSAFRPISKGPGLNYDEISNIPTLSQAQVLQLEDDHFAMSRKAIDFGNCNGVLAQHYFWVSYTCPSGKYVHARVFSIGCEKR